MERLNGLLEPTAALAEATRCLGEACADANTRDKMNARAKDVATLASVSTKFCGANTSKDHKDTQGTGLASQKKIRELALPDSPSGHGARMVHAPVSQDHGANAVAIDIAASHLPRARCCAHNSDHAELHGIRKCAWTTSARKWKLEVRQPRVHTQGSL